VFGAILKCEGYVNSSCVGGVIELRVDMLAAVCRVRY